LYISWFRQWCHPWPGCHTNGFLQTDTLLHYCYQYGTSTTNLLLCGFVAKCFFNASMLIKYRLKYKSPTGKILNIKNIFNYSFI